MKCLKFPIMTAFLFFLSVAFPLSSYAAYSGSPNPISPGFQLVPCDGVYVPCDFNALMELVNRIISFIFYLSIPLAAISFSYAGYLYVSAAGSEDKIKEAHKIFGKVMWGFILMSSAWLIVYSITSVLLGNDFKNSKSNLLRNNGVQSGSGSGSGVNGGSGGEAVGNGYNSSVRVGIINRGATDAKNLQFDFGDQNSSAITDVKDLPFKFGNQ
ncbi:MAG: hypothetical protein KGJ58_00780 [Patescibacteria group bacterium]|nr:hypothetical protein [Patescibacteria group bacterium]MDE1988158.1 hypothetical protein [Patescibacteria group bacterium]MDE2217978.1 hypothetical protein [Patescibacteria group bacterium]